MKTRDRVKHPTHHPTLTSDEDSKHRVESPRERTIKIRNVISITGHVPETWMEIKFFKSFRYDRHARFCPLIHLLDKWTPTIKK